LAVCIEMDSERIFGRLTLCRCIKFIRACNSSGRDNKAFGLEKESTLELEVDCFLSLCNE
jgi:hypothetical protein